jgi:dCMP deaminase
MEKRPSKDEYYLEIAKAVAQRSPCIRRKYGAVIVKNDAIVSTGYNGPARGVINCFEVGCIKDLQNLPHGMAYEDCPAVHAEENAVVNAARNGSNILGGTLYIAGVDKEGKLVEAIPCLRCRRILINAGIEKVVIRKEDGGIKYINIQDWVSEDTKTYLEKLKKAKKEKKLNND